MEASAEPADLVHRHSNRKTWAVPAHSRPSNATWRQLSSSPDRGWWPGRRRAAIAREHTDGRGLAGAVIAQESEDRPGWNGENEPVHGGLAAKPLVSPRMSMTVSINASPWSGAGVDARQLLFDQFANFIMGQGAGSSFAQRRADSCRG